MATRSNPICFQQLFFPKSNHDMVPVTYNAVHIPNSQTADLLQAQRPKTSWQPDYIIRCMESRPKVIVACSRHFNILYFYSTSSASYLCMFSSISRFLVGSINTMGCSPYPETLTTELLSFLVGNPYKPSLANATGKGTIPII